MKIYLAYRNADTTEGRGPMVLDRVFLHKQHADEYVDDQPGIMGRRGQWSKHPDDWRVTEVDVIEHSIVDARRRKEQLKQEALKKLTQAEREALGF